MNNTKPTFRVQRVTSLIYATIIDVLRNGKQLDPRLVGFPLTITDVKVSRDLKIVSCYFLPFNTNLSEQDLIEALNNSKYAIRSFVTKKINLKYSPEIRFFYDKSFNNTFRVAELLQKIKEEHQ